MGKMGVCNFYLIGKKDEIEKLGMVCKKVHSLLKTKYERDVEKLGDWTGISRFLIFKKPDESCPEEVIDAFGIENMKVADWLGCDWDENQALIWWGEIAWPHKIPSEVWLMMMREGKRLGVQHLVTKIITCLNEENERGFGGMVKLLQGLGKVEFPHGFS